MKVWVAEFSGADMTTKFELFNQEIDARVAAANMMTEYYGKEGDACEGDDVTEFRTIENYGGKQGLTKIVWVTDGFFPGAPDASVYQKEIALKALNCPVEFMNCDLGLYRIHWKSGGTSLASVGMTYEERWLAPTNWTCPKGGNPTTLLSKYVTEINKMEKII